MWRIGRMYQPWGRSVAGLGLRTTLGDARNRGRNRLKPVLQALEDRRLLATFTVTKTADDGSTDMGTLRWAVAQANASDTASSIEIELGTSAATIALSEGQLELSNTNAAIAIYDGSGQGPVTISGNGASRVFQVDKGVTASISGLTIAGGSTGGDGGGLYNAGTTTLSYCTISGNSGFAGGGLFNPGTTTLSYCTISGNSGAGSGGGLFNLGTTSLTACTLSGNSTSGATGGTGGGKAGHGNSGAGIGGGMFNRGTADLLDCTISGNSAYSGTGLFNYGVAALTACTVTGNTGGYGIYNYGYKGSSGTVTLTDTIADANLSAIGSGLDLGDSFPDGDASGFSGSYNLIQYAGPSGLVNGRDGNIVGVLPILAPLGDYGGPTQTAAVLPGSPAIGAGIAVQGVTTDQRGQPLDSPHPDIGAFQSHGFDLTVVAGSTPQSTAVGTAFANNLAVTVTANDPLDPVVGGQVKFLAPSSGASAILPGLSVNGPGTNETIGGDGIPGVAAITATANDIAGSYTVTASTTGAAAPVDFALKNVDSLGFSGLSDQNITYGTASVTVSGTLAYDSQSPVGESVAVTLDGVQQSAEIESGGAFSTRFDTTGLAVAGSPYTISYAYTSDGTFGSASATTTLTVAPATLTITAGPETKVYGTADPTLAYTASGFQFSDNAATVLTGTLARAQSGTLAGEQAGSYDITQGTLAADSDYTIDFTGSTLTITPATLTVTADPQTKVYATDDPSLADTATGFVDTMVDGVAIDDTAATVLTGALARAKSATLAGEQVGGYAISQGTLAADGDYTIAFTGSTLTINPATLTVTANPLTKVYGTNDPTLTVTPAGLVDTTIDGVTIDDTAATVLSGALARAQSGTLAGEQVGSYAITQGTLAADSDYTMSFTGGTLTITAAALTVGANPLTKVYGTNDPTLTDTATGFVDTTVDGVTIDDTAASALTGHLVRAAGETVAGGPYTITRGTLAGDSDYTIDFTGSTLTITPATLTVTADPLTKVYGTDDPGLTDTATGLVDATVDGVAIDDTAATVLTGALARAQSGTAAGEQVGGYAITQGTLAADSNYTIDFTGGTLTITPAPLTVTADPQTKVYGTNDPTLTVTPAGLVDTTIDGVTIDDTAATVLSGALARAQSGTVAGEQVGGYAITRGTLAASDYTIDFTGSTLAITPAPLPVIANPLTKVYGTNDPTLTVTPAGLVDTTIDGVTIDDTAATVLTGSLARAQSGTLAGEQVGSYAITRGTLTADSDYTMSFTGSTLTITAAALTVSANPLTKVYGTNDPGLTETVAGLVDTTVDGVSIDDAAASALTGQLARAAGETVAGGPYAITRGTLAADSNYTIDFTGSTLTITPATLTVTAQPETKVYGSADPTLAYTATGFQFSDTSAGVLTGLLSRSPGETVSGSPYAISQGALTANSNYTIRFTGSVLTITPATPAVTVNVTGGANTGSPVAANATVTGISGTAASSLEGVTPTLTYYAGSGTSGTNLGSTTPSAVGTYTVVASFPGSADYAAAQSKPTTFVIARGAATIALASSGHSAVYGQAVTFVATVSAGAGTPSGTVTFSDGATALATIPLDGSGQAVLTITSLALGSHAITATYNGDTALLGAQSGATAESVSQSATAIVLVPHPALKKKKLEAVGLTAEIEPVAPGGGVPTGLVTFEFLTKHRKKTRVKPLGSAALGGGEATLTFKPNKLLHKTLTIVYSGDPDFQASTMTSPKLTKKALL